MTFDKNRLKKQLIVAGKTYTIYQLARLKQFGFSDVAALPFSIRILLESVIRNFDGYQVTFEDVRTIAGWKPRNELKEIPFKPGRVILQDFTGVPCVVDLAAMREQMRRMGGDVSKINPQVPCDLVIDHSLQVDVSASAGAFDKNLALEFGRNKERYEFLKWGQQTFSNFRVVPPAVGIIHQVNLEYLASGILLKEEKVSGSRSKEKVLYPDSLVGTDSHTTMINGVGVVGWGVGGIEAEAVMLGEALCMVIPEVVGVRLSGRAKDNVTATDIVLTIVEMLRKHGVVDKFVEFYGPGLEDLSIPDRATISNMCPEYGATVGIFPVDKQTIDFYKLTGRANAARLLEAYFKAQGLFDPYAKSEPVFSSVLSLDLSSVEPSLSGPRRPQDRLKLQDLKRNFQEALVASNAPQTSEASGGLTHGSVVLAAITSCTNTSNPSVMIGAGLLAQKAVAKGLKVPSFVKTSLTPGSQVVDYYLKRSGLLKSLEQLGFHNVGYGCATCIGNSGPLEPAIAGTIEEKRLMVASVTSGNRNFEGRINPHVKANYLASPILVVAYALAGSVSIDLTSEPIGVDKNGEPVFLKDIWPGRAEIREAVNKYVTAAAFKGRYRRALLNNISWSKVRTLKGELYKWDPASTYIQEPPYFGAMKDGARLIKDIKQARVLIYAGDSITTDHISPAGNISASSPAGKYLLDLGVERSDFNSYGARRGNDRVMTRGTFANIRFQNKLVPGTEGSTTLHFPDGEKVSIFAASELYKKTSTPLIVLAGKEYGTGSSRDWAAKGPALLGVNAVIAESFERIHRSNLAGMGILPLQFISGESAAALRLSGQELYDITGLTEQLKPRQQLQVTATDASGTTTVFTVIVRLDTMVEIDYYRQGGILQTVLRKLAIH